MPIDEGEPYWIRFAFEEHFLQPVVAQIVLSTYQHLDPHNIPILDNRWYSTASLSYKPQSPSDPNPAQAHLTIREGASEEFARHTRFVLNLLKYTVSDKLTNEPAIHILPEVESLIDTIMQFVREDLIEKRDKAEEERILRENERVERVNIFRNLLLTKDLITAEEANNDSGFCPLCRNKLVLCQSCNKFLCSDPTENCSAWLLHEALTCKEHLISYCKPCRISEEPDGIPKLLECPNCGDCKCATDLYWCFGHPILTPDHKRQKTSLESAPNQDISGQQERTHKPMWLCCPSCLGLTKGVKECHSDICWSHRPCAPYPKSYKTLICQICADEGGRQRECKGGHKWICDVCSKKSWLPVWECPLCERQFCEECPGYPGRCAECLKIVPCKDCTAGDSVDVPEFIPGCNECEVKVCIPCSREGFSANCYHCRAKLCRDCQESDNCFRCGKPMLQCSKCFLKPEVCGSCRGLSRRLLQLAEKLKAEEKESSGQQ